VKYTALLLNLIAAGMLVWGVAGAASLMGARTSVMRPPVVELRPLSDKDISAQADIAKALTAIASLGERRHKGVELARAALIAQPAPGMPGTIAAAMPTRTVTLLARHSEGYTAVVDGALVRVGARLSHGGRVIDISDGRVTIAEMNGKQTLTVAVDSLRVGTLQTRVSEGGRQGGVAP
jgi:hypothetical protein